MDSNVPRPTPLNKDKSLVAAPYRFRIFRDHPNHSDIVTCEID
jgi:hypothetical protein